jgi:hypothetical protein
VSIILVMDPMTLRALTMTAPLIREHRYGHETEAERDNPHTAPHRSPQNYHSI